MLYAVQEFLENGVVLLRYVHKPRELGSSPVEVTAKEKSVLINQRATGKSSNKMTADEVRKYLEIGINSVETSLIF